MRGYFAANTISEEERSNILSQHKTLYNGYQAMNPEIPNTQPLYVQDFAKDKVGAVMGNKGNIKGYTNMGINEQSAPKTPTKVGPYGLDVIKNENDYNEFTDVLKVDYDLWKGSGCCNKYIQWKEKEWEAADKLQASGDKDGYNEKIKSINSISRPVVSLVQPLLKYAAEKGINGAGINQLGISLLGQILDQYSSPELKQQLGGRPVATLIDEYFGNLDTFKKGMANYIDSKIKKLGGKPISEQSFPYDKPIVSEGECSECGGMMEEGVCNECGYGSMEEETGHLDDIYHEEDLDPNAEFDYVKGASNKTNAFHVKENMMKTPIGKISAIGGMKEQGGNADDMDVDDVEPAYDFVSNGPMDGGDVYPVNEDGDEEMNFDDLIDMDTDIESERDNLEQEGYEQMESAWADDIDEVDISGSQGIYGDMDPAYDFDSEGPGNGGPYQEFHGKTVSNDKGEMEEQPISKLHYNKMKRKKSAIDKGEEFDDTELDISDYEGDFDRETSSWEDVSKITNDDEFGYVDEDIRESVIIQKNRIMEMMNRMKVIK